MSHSALPGADQNVTPQAPEAPAAPVAPPVAPPAGMTQDDFTKLLNAERERVRQEEKDKLYPQLNTLKTELDSLRSAAEERQRAEEEARQRAAAEQKAKDEEELSAKELLQREREEWNAKFTAMQEDQARRDALFEKERQRQELANYTAQKVAEASDEIMPELIPYITGETPEQVDQSIATAKANSASILENARKALLQQRAAIPGVSPTAGNVGPLEQQDSTRQLSPEEIMAMPVTSPEYERLRQQYGLAGAGRGKGMFQ